MRKILTVILLTIALPLLAQTVTDTLFDRSKYEHTFAFGADISWLTQQEKRGTVYRNRKGEPTELMQILQDEQGINAVRFRVWVNPRGGWSGKDDVINLCKRAHAKGLKIMVGFHYSDSWADPEKQTIPAEWTDHSLKALCRNIYDHTYDVLSSLKAIGITPQWVQIGNETYTGMLWETGRTGTKQGYKNFAAMINSGYRAIKDVDPSIQAIIHLPNAHNNKRYREMFDQLKKYKAKWDIIGMSAYPHWSKLSVATPDSLAYTLDKYMTNIRDMKLRYGKPVMIVETGHYNRKPIESNHFLVEFMRQLIAEGVLGCFFWEPESMGGYELGAWNPRTHQASIAMDAFKGIRHRERTAAQLTNPDVHDPVMACEDGRYYIFSTGMYLSSMHSDDMKTWTVGRPVMPEIPQWAMDSVPGYRGHTWAPDIQRVGDTWYMYYSCSTFGKNGSAIGLMTSKSINPESPDYGWEDRGVVVKSTPGVTDWNAIDPNMILDEQGNPWLTWGSFWDGIQLVRLEKDFVTPVGEPQTIARRYLPKNMLEQLSREDRERAAQAPNAGANAIEAPFLIREGDFYYLFASWDYCCKGANSNYKTVVGRSRRIEGPYLDRSGKPMAEGGGEIIAQRDEQYYGIGHTSAYRFDGQWYFMAHGYSIADNGMSKLVIKKMQFDADGWPALIENE